jgi:hypothetical protein
MIESKSESVSENKSGQSIKVKLVALFEAIR